MRDTEISAAQQQGSLGQYHSVDKDSELTKGVHFSLVFCTVLLTKARRFCSVCVRLAVRYHQLDVYYIACLLTILLLKVGARVSCDVTVCCDEVGVSWESKSAMLRFLEGGPDLSAASPEWPAFAVAA